ncbi:MAG: hypothetical protein ACOY4F_06090 [Thermodesulfobacteriota bacterium]
MRKLLIPLLAVWWLTAAAHAAPLDLTGKWSAEVVGLTVAAEFTQNDKLLSGVLVLRDITGQSNTYHFSGTIVDGFFAAVHGSGHMLRGTMHGPNEADAELTLKGAQPLPIHMRRVR